MQGGWQPPPGGGGGQGYGAPPPGYPTGQQQGYAGTPSMNPYPPNPYGAPQQPGMGGMPPMMGGGASYGNYEFNDTENAIIDKAASRAKLWGIISAAIGGLQVLSSCGAVANAGLATNFPSGVVAIIVGVTFLGLGNSLKAVVQTQGNDLMHMMQALDKMSSAFMVQIVCAIIGFVLTAIAFVIIAFVLVATAASR
ncbi:MAG: hypothetical protein JWP97_1378 [Labilithrix sp.]|nr:hypothetical protein [Labilithrix sp.]